MSDEITFNYNIDSSWSIIKVIRDKVESLLASKDEHLAYICKMTASELVENAVKYGCAIDDEKGIDFNFSLTNKKVKIEVSNGITHLSDFENVKKHTNEINATKDPHELYVKRLTVLMEQKNVRQSQLGLYRIAYEGAFKLQYDFNKEKNVLTVSAIKEI